jgi:penicillin-binding protein 2
MIAGLFTIIVMDLFYIQVIQGRYFYNLSVNNCIRVVPLEGWRGRIKDRNGKILADNRLSYDVMVTPQDIHKTKGVFEFLAGVLGVDTASVLLRYGQRKTAPFDPVTLAEDIPFEKAIEIEENKYRFPGFFIQETYRRNYPLQKNSAHVLGYTGKVNRAQKERFREYGYSLQSVTGYSGVEEYYDAYLRGEEGGLQVEVNSRGQQVRLLGLREPKKGQDITLTIDSDIQQNALELLEDRIGVIVVMDTDSGEILSLVSSPSFDPNAFGDSRRQGEVSRLFADSSAPIFNRAIKGVYPPGSVFKVVLATAGLHLKKIMTETSFVCTGLYSLGRAGFRCTHVHGSQNLIASLAHSCNIYYYNVGILLGAETIRHYARWLGLGEMTHIDLPYEESGSIPSLQQRIAAGMGRWHAGDTLNLSIGQGDVLVTPLQLVRMMAMIARQGVIVQPHVIKAIAETEVEKFSLERNMRIEERVLQIIQKGLRAAVTDFAGTAHVLDVPDMYVAGKTGTAQTSGGKKTHAWFAGYVRGEKKNIALCIFLEHGGSSYNACLIARSLLLGMKERKAL